MALKNLGREVVSMTAKQKKELNLIIVFCQFLYMFILAPVKAAVQPYICIIQFQQCIFKVFYS